MSSQGDLPQWAASAGQPANEHLNRPPEKNGKRRILYGVLTLMALAATAFGGYLLAGFLDGDSTDTATDPAAPTATDDDDDETDETDETDDTKPIAEAAEGATEGTGEADDEEALTVEGTTTTEAPTDTTSDDDEDDDSATDDTTEGDASARTAVFRQGKLFLGGAVPSQEIADAIVAKAQAVVGPDNVVADYDIDPEVDFDPGESTPLFVEDVVLFQFNSVSIDPPFLPILDLGVLLLRQNPQATVTVVTTTDAVGSEETNLEVATQRATAVLEYWVSKGVDPSQVVLDPRGEEGASESDDEQTAATQRRAQFILTNILG